MELGFDGQIEADGLKQWASPGAGGGHDNWRVDVTLVGGDANHTPRLHLDGSGLSARQIADAGIAGVIEEIVGYAGAVSVAGVGFVGGEFDFVHAPIGLEGFEFVASDE